MRTILIHSDIKGAYKFREILLTETTDFHVALSTDQVELEEVEVLIMWLYTPDYLSQLPNLKMLLICGSGIDHIINSPGLPHNTPLIRLVDEYLRDHVSDYVVEHIFKHFFPKTKCHKQKEALCTTFTVNELKKPKIGIMGLGLIGASTAQKLLQLGFEVCGWVRSSRPRPIKEVYIGTGQLKDFANNCEVLICLLPLTKETRGILNKHLFALLPEGTYLINVGRGAHLVEDDLLPALESGKLSGACLDVFEVEPLPSEHPFHAHPKITVTPHIAGYVSAETQAPYAAQIISSFYRNDKVEGIVK